MRDGWLGDRDVQNLARQVVDLLDPNADVRVEALNFGGRSAQWGGLSMTEELPRRAVVRIGPGNECALGVNPEWSVLGALGNLIAELSAACGHKYRGVWFPDCPGHDHPADIETADDAVILRCPTHHNEVSRIVPDVDPS
jgi:hypothetical protein